MKSLITPRALPTRKTIYDTALEQFLAAGVESAVVNIDGKPASLAYGLKTAIKRRDLSQPIDAVTRGEEVYLVRKHVGQ